VQDVFRMDFRGGIFGSGRCNHPDPYFCDCSIGISISCAQFLFKNAPILQLPAFCLLLLLPILLNILLVFTSCTVVHTPLLYSSTYQPTMKLQGIQYLNCSASQCFK